jgi:hAT family C-terminal dimerisation region
MKDLNFASDSERLATKDLLKKAYEKLKSQNQNNNSSFINVNNDESSKKSKNALSVFANLKKKISPADDEVGVYLLLEEIDLESNPFAWWYERREKFPILSYLARQYLAVFACSTASEQLFSDAGNLLTPKRTRMSPKLFRRLMFLKRNSKHLDSIHESHES